MPHEHGHAGRILNVNDVPYARAYKTAVLRNAGYEVLEAGTADETRRRVSHEAPELLLLDVRLPDGNGIDLCEELLRTPSGEPDAAREMAVVLITAALTTPDDIARGAAAGASAYLVEPVSPEYLVGVAQSVLRSHRAQRVAAAERVALRERERKYRLLADTLSNIVWDWDLRTDAVERSDAVHRILRYEPGSVGSTSQWWVDRIHPEDRARVMDALHRAIEQGSAFECEYRFQYGDGSYATMLDHGAVLTDANGRPVRMVGGMSDLTERQRLAEQLRAAQKMEAIGLLAGGIAHDFNNVLTAVLGFAGLLKAELTDRPTALDYATEIESAAQRAANLTAQLLAFGRRQVLKAEIVDINDVLTGITRMLTRLLEEHIRVRLEPGADVPAIRADPTQLEQVLVNLAVNARDAMPEGGELVVSTEAVAWPGGSARGRQMSAGSYVRLAVRDTGGGMDEETRQRIFEPFFTTKGRGKGTGLGLATVYGIVKQSGGYIWVDSAPGAGTTFEIFLPAAQDAAAPRVAPAATQSSARGAGETILLVEDERSVRQLAAEVLRRAGYQVLEAADGREALAAAQQHAGALDLLLTDMVLPDLSGPATAEALRARRPELRVLFMSGYSSDAHGRAPRPVPGPLLPKPFTASGLRDAVRRLLHAGAGT
jgi:PAS domain S-box-containing protein